MTDGPQDPGSKLKCEPGAPFKASGKDLTALQKLLRTKTHLRTAQARPSGCLPALIFPVTVRDFRSMTTM